MTDNKVRIDNKIYNSATGELISDVKRPKKTSPIIQPRAQSSKTIRRSLTKKPQLEAKVNNQIIKKRAYHQPNQTSLKSPVADITSNRDQRIRHFAKLTDIDVKHNQQVIALNETSLPPEIVTPDQQTNFKKELKQARHAKLSTHWRVYQIRRERLQQQLKLQREAERQALPVSSQRLQKPLKQIKNETISRALEQKHPASQPLPKIKFNFKRFWQQNYLYILATALMIIMGTILFILNFANLSLKLASNQVGFEASYPNYRPTGYTISKLPQVTEKTINFSYNNNQNNIKISQQANHLDSETVLENFVKPFAKDKYIKNNFKGLTIYTYDKHAIWVNGGILYKIEYSDLAQEEIFKIATSF